MNWSNQPATESRVGPPTGSDAGPEQTSIQSDFSAREDPSLLKPITGLHDQSRHLITVRKARVSLDGSGKEAEVFTMTLGDETIELLPLRNWGQLDVYKWRVRGKLPGTPAGLEVTAEHVKIEGETVAIGDPDGCGKLENAFNEWLALEDQSLELVRKKAQAKPPPAPANSSKERPPQTIHFRVEVDKRAQVHVICSRGSEMLAAIGLTRQGFGGLFSQGLMRKPRALDIGALHDWIELDGELCSFEHGNNDAKKLEKLLNERYVPLVAPGQGTDILVFANAASPTGFDVQFPVTIGGVEENRRRTLNDAALELLQEPNRCGLLRPGLIIKLSPPTFIFKRKTSDGGEAYVENREENTVHVTGDDGRERLINLSQPVNYSHLSVVEMMAVFNHPSVNRHGKGVTAPDNKPVEILEPFRPPVQPVHPAITTHAEISPAVSQVVAAAISKIAPDPEPTKPELPKSEPLPATLQHEASAPPAPPPNPNAWLAEVLTKTPIRHDWFTFLIFARIAQHFGNSREGTFGPSKCWFVAFGDAVDISVPDFKGLFLTEKGGLGFTSNGHLARFHRGVVFLGTPNAVVEGIDINLRAVGLDEQNRIVFIVADEYLSKFGTSGQIIRQELVRLSEAGALLLSVREACESPLPLEVVWTVPAEQTNPSDPQAVESVRPESACELASTA